MFCQYKILSQIQDLKDITRVPLFYYKLPKLQFWLAVASDCESPVYINSSFYSQSV